jgi:transcriptional regulator with XRE-family HTH domain
MPNPGPILKSLRDKFGFVQETVAEYLGISRELVSMYETGEREVPIEILEKLSNLFCIEPDAFFAETSEEAIAQVAFAFRKDEMSPEDLKEMAAFGKIVKNYLKIKRLNDPNKR